MSAPALVAADLRCLFDVSPPWLTRMIERKPRQVLRAVDGVSFAVPRGSTFSIVGESGCGKSTIARTVVGLGRPTEGAVSFPGSPPGGPRLQMIFQDPYASLNPRWRVDDIIAEPIRELKLISSEDGVRERVAQLLRTVGLSPRDGSRYPHEFSGGQRQRISIARALATEAEVLVCDEPTSALDVSVQAQVLNLMRSLQLELGLTYLLISHNLAVVRHLSDAIAIMYLGRFVETGPADEIFERPSHPYTRLLLDTIPDLDAPNRARAPLQGEVPSAISPPSGCAFHPRCPLVADRCRTERPELRTFGGALVACHFA